MMIRSRARPQTDSPPEHAQLLDSLVRERGVGPHVIFFLDDEGEPLPNGAETSSGYVLDRLGRVYAFWVGWDPERESATFTLWEPVESDPDWLENAEYRRALDALHIDPRGRANDEPAVQRYPSRVASITAFA